MKNDIDDIELELKQVEKDAYSSRESVTATNRLFLRVAVLAVRVLNSGVKALRSSRE